MTEDTITLILLAFLCFVTFGSCQACYAISEAPGIIRAARCAE